MIKVNSTNWINYPLSDRQRAIEALKIAKELESKKLTTKIK